MPVAILPINTHRYVAADGLVPKRLVAPDPRQPIGGDEEDYIEFEDPSLIYSDELHTNADLSRMNTLRRERESCDLVLFVAEREILAHRSVLCAFSATLADLVAAALTQQEKRKEGQANVDKEERRTRPLYLEFPTLDFDSFDALITYAYTSKLEVASKKVADVYKTASYLRVESAAQVAAKYLVGNLSPTNAIGVRKCANKTSDVELAGKVDEYIQDNFSELIDGSPEFTGLACVQAPPPSFPMYPLFLTSAHPHSLNTIAGNPIERADELPDSVMAAATEARDAQISLALQPEGRQRRRESGGGRASADQGASRPGLKVEVIGNWGEAGDVASMELATRVLAWFQSQPNTDHREFRMEYLTQGSHLLYLDSASVLRDCRDIEDSVSVSSCDLVADYRVRRRYEGRDSQSAAGTPTASLLINPAAGTPSALTLSSHGQRYKSGGSPPSPQEVPLISSHSLNLAAMGTPSKGMMSSSESINSISSSVSTCDADEIQWNIIAVAKYSDSFVIGLAVMHQRLVSLSIQVINSATRALKGPDGASTEASPTRSPGSPAVEKEATPALVPAFPLPSLAGQRCSHGLVALGGRLVVAGGYDRGECLASVEELRMDAHGFYTQWNPLAPMTEERGRFDAVAVGERIYAVGGSNGVKDLASVEVFDNETGAWAKAPSMLFPKSNHGLAQINGRVLCVGGWNGQVGIKEVEVLDTAHPEAGWSLGPPLNTGRYQAGCTAYPGGVIAAGGCEHWGVLSSVEQLAEGAAAWEFLPDLTTGRRGCGVVVAGGKLWVVGGSDGARSLASTEVLDLSAVEKGWAPGPALITPRANVRVVALQDRLVVVGGFSGKAFLSTMEYLDFDTGEWRSFNCKATSPGVA